MSHTEAVQALKDMTVVVQADMTPCHSTVRDFLRLLKPGVMSLVVYTAAIGLLLAPGDINPFLALVVIFCVAVGSGASGAINMWYDRDIDAIMSRTRNRPIPAGKIAPSDGLAFGIVLAFFAVSFLGLASNWIAAAWLAFTIFFYVIIYTMWLKRLTPQNIVIGGAAGAFPPIIGWMAVSQTLTLEPFLLFLIIFLWTPPHFWALALHKSDEYKKAGVPMLPVTAGAQSTKTHILIYSILLVGVTFIPYGLGFYSVLYLGSAVLLGGNFLRLALLVYFSKDARMAMKLFGYSILYLFALFGAMLADRILL